MSVPYLDRHAAFFNLQEAVAQPGCPVCRLKRRWTDGYLDAILYESVTDKFFRARLAKTEGFCRTHGWLLADKNSALGGAILSRDRLDRLCARLGERKVEKAKGLAPCLLCDNEREAESRYLSVLAGGLHEDEAFRAAFAAGDGVCFPHLERLVALLPREAARETLALHRRLWAALSAEIGAFVDKFDYQQSARLVTDDEKTRWKRAVEVATGLDRTV